ncbi:20890_t:CDS:2, partial [Racocetra persica]
ELTILDSVEEIIDDMKDIVEIKKVDASLRIIYKTINISVPIITIGMLEKIKKTKEYLKSLYKLECEIHPTPKYPTFLSNIQHDIHDNFKASKILKKQKSILLDLYADNNNKISEIDNYLALEEEGDR